MGFHDLPLAERLLIARRGTAYFAQRLAELSDSDLDGQTLLSGWSRRHLLAHVGYNAAALCRLLDWAATGIETPMYASAEQRGREIVEGATLSAAALRNLFDHTVARLDEKWRNLPASAWDAQVRTAQGRLVPVSETAWMRTREVWIHAVDLGNGGRFGDFPDVVLESLLTDIVGMWRRKDLGAGLMLAVDGNEPVAVRPDSPPAEKVSGPLAAVVRWAAGRGTVGVNIDGEVGEPPRWL
ncbi:MULTISPECIES: maleylpyruvate isomerase family mycothiol-dependent enzyme [unclassified Rhodococcus (in: high G+C Gram-positive bacteria)]|uniref:maleylpyruvate isomerase family mycothiol-dependent enzyme n=1 Tax=unclassified Rhodococcus (in: high G+C Gram-positive bacteria) TaxID=192944 RepID=UPI0024B756AC|nr:MULTISPECIES: maleylpyruvate isomerase family mycothiol-dependent enzyme [unclassified Rhodococcus (in: high G+C Gram-positive bacteria)]MDI9950260.1 maleylpyruvate isomerase family mycothiol-dependent enzyme [Rhodococcus sp. IEGM 1305]MDI9972940.1 maleylpyruvate isomerase family mycothiol-dependent enzyme [Rhodococcus sp. IEGM 1307]